MTSSRAPPSKAVFVAMERAAFDCLKIARIAGFDSPMGAVMLGRAEKLTCRATELADALSRQRHRGQQTIRIEHVTVESGARGDRQCDAKGENAGVTVNPGHIRTGRPKGAPVGNTRTLKHGRRSGWAVAHRKQIAALMRESRALLRQADPR